MIKIEKTPNYYETLMFGYLEILGDRIANLLEFMSLPIMIETR